MTDFESARLQAATSFLQTVVLLDDRAAFATTDGGVSDEGDLGGDAPLDEPDETEVAPAPAPAEEARAAPLARPAEQALNAGLITRGFAAKGLVCAVLRPQPDDDLEQETLLAARRADIVVLDWEMEDRGEKATEIVKHLFENDANGGGRLRLVSIYTGHSPLSNVYGALKASLVGFAPPPGKRDADLILEGPNKFRIIILSKSVSANAPGERRFTVGEAELPDRVIKEFARFAGGLLPNTTLATIAALRDKTHRMLARLDNSLDGPIITHSILVGDAGDPDAFVASVIMEELESQVSPARVAREYAGRSSIAAYFAHHIDHVGLRPKIRLSPNLMQAKQELAFEEVKSLVDNGLGGITARTDDIISGLPPGQASDYRKSLAGSLHKRLYLLTGDEEGQKRKDHEQFALITGMRRDKSTVDPGDEHTYPMLKLGTVLRCGGQYWVCLTPICDCVRIPSQGGSFLFAELMKSDNDWNVIVNCDGSNIKLRAERKRQTLQSVVFEPSSEGIIRPKFVDGKVVFVEMHDAAPQPDQTEDRQPTLPPDHYEWLGEMKPMQAQRMVQNFASNISRVGLDEFEWQRRQAPPA